MDIVMWTKQPISFKKSRKFTRQYRNNYKESKQSIRHDMTSIELSIVFKLVTKSGCTSAKKDCKGKVKS